MQARKIKKKNMTSFCVHREPSTEEHLLPASPSEREIAVPVSALSPVHTEPPRPFFYH